MSKTEPGELPEPSVAEQEQRLAELESQVNQIREWIRDDETPTSDDQLQIANLERVVTTALTAQAKTAMARGKWAQEVEKELISHAEHAAVQVGRIVELEAQNSEQNARISQLKKQHSSTDERMVMLERRVAELERIVLDDIRRKLLERRIEALERRESTCDDENCPSKQEDDS